ncbi:MAG: hypothetical protein ABR507_08330 [Actinomycetota bacterium]|nr:hypothetical protein [Actinomycetota bacterium]
MSTPEPDLIALAREEAKAIIEEAREQARVLAQATQGSDRQARSKELIGALEESIARLSEIVEEIRQQLA